MNTANLNRSLKNILELCAKAIIKDIQGNVGRRTKLDGSPQKVNQPSTIKQKGHDWQLRAKHDKFLKNETYKLTVTPQRVVIIFDYPAPGGVNVGIEVTKRGYRFWGISGKAQKVCHNLLAAWFRTKVINWVKNELKQGIRGVK